MRLNIAPAPWPGAPVVVLSAGLGGGGGYWLAQRAALEAQYQLVSYDHNGTGENAGPLPADYSMATMAQELLSALQAAGITRFALVGHALGALIGLQLALDRPEAVERPGAGQRLADAVATHPPLLPGARASTACRRRAGVG